jgi:hypothetical protein
VGVGVGVGVGVSAGVEEGVGCGFSEEEGVGSGCSEEEGVGCGFSEEEGVGCSEDEMLAGFEPTFTGTAADVEAASEDVEEEEAIDVLLAAGAGLGLQRLCKARPLRSRFFGTTRGTKLSRVG